MASFRVVTPVAAPVELCFDLSRDIDFHTTTMASTGERAVAGRTSGLIELGETVTWEAKHLGVRQRLTVEITALERPTYFRDVMTKGAFRSMEHDHKFEVTADDRTIMIDEVVFRSPFGPLGRLVDWAFLTGYMRRLLTARAADIKREAERRVAAGL